MPIGRISGPLLAQNLFRDDIDLAFYNRNSTEFPLIYLNVVGNKVGIRTDTPAYDLDVRGTINGDILRVVDQGNGLGYGTIGKIFISTNTVSSTVGPVNISPSGGNDINLQSNTTVFGDLHATGNITADGDIGLGNVPTDRLKIVAEVDSNIIPALDNTYNLGASGAAWKEAYVNKVVTNNITATGNISITPSMGLLEINSQLRVNSSKGALGTAPIVTNVLYVTVDGDDTNDGSAMDSTRACRTISGAVRSPLYKPGTSIKVAPGRYYEDNPILMQPYTSIIGSDLRTTFVEPINKTQDLFHVQSGCYIAQLQMSGGRSGLLPIENASGFNRGAYCTAFPPQVGGKKIDIFRSPYIQNCTNESGPWLKDGTMFLPNQTVQIPRAVGISSWPANTTTLIVSLTTGSIAVGDSINAGPANMGFFDARTLILANKSFIQQQTVNWINNQIATATTGSIWKGFKYSQAKCFRDVGIILENVSYDTTFGGNEKSVESGLAYYDGVISVIVGQEPQTIAAINYVNSLTQKVIINSTVTTIGAVTNPQVINYVLDEGSVAGPGFQNNINIITDIISRGPSVAPKINKSQGPDAYIISAEVLLQANRAFIQNEVTAYTDVKYSSINYNQDKCKRDLNLIVDAIGFDLLFPTAQNSQSTFAGLQYWDQSGYTGDIANELTTTTNAISYLSTLAREVVTKTTTGARYQSTLTQVTNLPTGSVQEQLILETEFNLILDIIINGTVGVTDRIVPNRASTSTDFSVVNAYNLLLANKSYMQAEVVAWVEQNKTTGFLYDVAKCARDVGYMIDSVAFDLLYGGNKQAIQSGVYYYSFNGSSSAIAGTIPQTIYAYNTLTNIVQNIVQNISVPTTQTKVVQNTSLPAATNVEATLLTNYLNTILNIINNGPGFAAAKVPISLVRSTSTNITRAFNILQANKEFIREEVVARTNNVYFRQNSYNKVKCYRDSGLIVDAVVQDILFPTTDNSQSTFAGLMYWNQGTTVIPGQVSTTTNAWIYAKSLCQKIVLNDTSNPRYSTGTQVTSLPAATLEEFTLVGQKFDAMLDIIQNGITGVTDKIVPNSITADFQRDVKQAFDILQANKSYIQQEVISYVDATKTVGWVYDKVKCARDAGYIIDSIAFDLLYGGNKQSIQCGVYYYGFTAGSSAIYGQTTGTIAAFNRIRTIIPAIIRGEAVTPYQTVEKQVYDTSTFTSSTIATAVGKVDIITNIIGNGPIVASAPSPISVTASTSTSVQSAAKILAANRNFIQAETVAFVDQFFAFTYNRDKCSRDAGLIVDAITYDLIVGGNSKSIESGISYWVGTKSYINGQIPQTVDAVERARLVALDIIENKLVTRTVGNGTEQITNSYYANGQRATSYINSNFGIIKNIMTNGESAAPQNYLGSGLFAATGISFNDTKIAPKVISVQNFAYDETLCRRDTGYILDGTYFDIGLGTNYNAVTSGNAYRRGIKSSQFVINYELSQTKQAISYVKSSSANLVVASPTSVTRSNAAYDELVRVLEGNPPATITFTNPTGASAAVVAAKDQLIKNKNFIVSEVVAWVQYQVNYNIAPFVGFSYTDYIKQKCARDIGYIIDALCYDILYGGNSASRYCAEAYFTFGVSTIPGEETQSVAAFNRMSAVAQQVIQGIAVTRSFGSSGVQDRSGANATGIEATTLASLVAIITNVITAGNLSGLPAKVTPSTAWAAADVQTAIGVLNTNRATLINGTISYVNAQAASGLKQITLDRATIGPSFNATLYFGDTLVFPKQDKEFTAQEAIQWGQRMVDQNGAMGGSLVDGGVVSERSPVNSFVYDAFTQVNQGGRGIHIINNGYAQLVSVFTIFCSTHVEVTDGGIASITNSNANFGNLCLVAKGKGPLDFGGTVYNPPYPTFEQSGSQTVNGQFYPNGYWPQNAEVLIYLPDQSNRPHIGQVMEVVPPEYILTDTTGFGNFVETPYSNEQGLPGFLLAAPNKSTLTTGTIKITDIDTDGIAKGHTVYVRDQFGSFVDNTGTRYCATGTVVTDIGWREITLNQSLTSGGGDVDNDQFFTLLFCGNAYYNVLTSTTSTAVTTGTTVIPPAQQLAAEIDALTFMSTLVQNVVANNTIIAANPSVIQNKSNPSGAAANSFLADRFNEIVSIVTSGPTVAPQTRKTGTSPPQASEAIVQINANRNFIVAEVTQRVINQGIYVMNAKQTYKCKRDTSLILDKLILDLTNGGNYNSVYSGLSYYVRPNTHHIVSLEDQVRNPLLFPDGATVNFYQRSYMSALGYTFEYVGAGVTYGGLPQRGIADPKQNQEVTQIDNGKVFFTSTDQNGDFRIGPGLVISQATGVLSGRTFTKSLFAQMTPFILAVEAGG